MNSCKQLEMKESFDDTFDVYKFIRCVRDHPAIWDSTCNDYQERRKKENSWMNVGERMFEAWNKMSIEEKKEGYGLLRSKWRHVRDNYFKSLRNRICGGAKRCHYAEEIKFLLKVMPHRKTKSAIWEHFPLTAAHLQEKLNLYTETLDDDDDADRPKPQKKIKRNESTKESTSSTVVEVIEVYPDQCNIGISDVVSSHGTNMNSNEISSEQHTPSNLEKSTVAEYEDDKLFLLSLLPMMRKLNDDDKLEFRLNVLHILQEFRKKHSRITSLDNSLQSYSQECDV